MIIGFSMNRIESARHVPMEELIKYRNINVNYDINLKNPSIVRTYAGYDSVLRVEYSVTINYLNPTIGFIRFEGYCDHAGSDVQKSYDDWEAGRPDLNIQNEIANNVMMRIVPMAMLLSQNLNLPPAVPIPMVNFQRAPTQLKKEERFDSYHA